MQPFEKKFIELALESDVLSFGDFTLKSGRHSPYFFNAGKFDTGKALTVLGQCYADAIIHSGIEFDMVFGPAYKGIPLATTVVVALSDHYGQDIPYGFNRKEKKDHGEGGTLVGASVEGKKVLIVDDVITAGTAIREALGMIREAGGQVAGVAIGLDRQEKGEGELSAVQELTGGEGFPVVSVVSLCKIIEYMESEQGGGGSELVARIREHQQQYGVE
jgi:orotate phosphoribosyltransferase